MTTLVVWRLDRLTRSVTDLMAIAKEREIGLRSLGEQIGTTTRKQQSRRQELTRTALKALMY